MKQFTIRYLVIVISLFIATNANYVLAQNVDSIRVEQAGDFVKIYYKIIGSNQYQTFRVSIMASINGGLRSELRSVSGDIGENIVGGRSEYLILWDVLKDVEELNSVEFFVKSELLRDLSEPQKTRKQKVDNKFEKRIFNVMPMVSIPGLRLGGMIGINGSFGLLTGLAFGEVSNPIEHPSVSDGNEYHKGEGIQIVATITKRLVSHNSFQLHAMAGYSAAAMDYSIAYYAITPPSYRFDTVITNGLVAGLLFGSGRFSAALMLIKYDPGSVEEKNDNYYMISRMALVSAGIGVRF